MKLDLRALNTLVLLAALAGTVAASPASATIISVTSSATVLDVALSVLTIPIAVGPLYLAAGAAPPPAYSSANGFASYSISSGPFSLTTGLLSDTASGNLATGGTASSSLASFDLSVASGPITYLAFAASAVSSTTSVHDSATSAGVNWSSTLADATLTVLGLSITIGTNPPTNDVIYNAGGLTITLNRVTPDPLETFGVTTDALALNFTGFPVVFGTSLNLVNGSIDIAQSYASEILTPFSVIPETSTWAMMLLGFAGLGFAGYRRRIRLA
jgi:hypothetical protein